MTIEQLITSNAGTIVDVRSPQEFSGGNVLGSINIPVQELGYRLEEVNLLPKPLILCCASGGRSGMAAQMLQQQGIECYNAGSWMDVNYLKTK